MEQAHLGADIVVVVFVVVHVIPGDVRQCRRHQVHAVEAMLRETMRRGLHRRVSATLGRQPRKKAMQHDRLGRGHGQRLLEPLALDAGGAERRRPVTQGRPNLAGEVRDRGLPVGSRDRHHHLWLSTMEGGRQPRQFGPGPRRQQEGHRQGTDVALCSLQTLGRADDRRRTLTHRVWREISAVQFGARHSDKDKPVANLAAVDGQTCHRHVRIRRRTGMGHGAQPQRSQRCSGLGHDPTPVMRPASAAVLPRLR